VKAFLAEPLRTGNLEALCDALVKYEADARLNGTIAVERAIAKRRTVVKTEGLCRDCGCKLTDTNRSSGTGYQCRACRTTYMREAKARSRADLKVASTT
jgi:tRNA(Ile2) C34 agmatinyltransferase TiaS